MLISSSGRVSPQAGLQGQTSSTSVECRPATAHGRWRIWRYSVQSTPADQREHEQRVGYATTKGPWVALAGTPHELLPSRAHILMDVITLPFLLSGRSPPTETRARANRLRLPGRDCRHQWLGPLPVHLFPGNGVAHRRYSDHDSSAAGVRVGDGRWCPCKTPTGLRAAQELPGSPRAQARQGTVARIHDGRCFLLDVAKKNKIQGFRASSLYPLPLGCPPVSA